MLLPKKEEGGAWLGDRVYDLVRCGALLVYFESRLETGLR